MKTQFAFKSLWTLAVGGLLAASAQFARAQITAAPVASSEVVDNQAATVHLSYGVPEVLKLSTAHVGDDAIVAYIASTGIAYNLSVNEIVYLKNQGVSERVLTAMLMQHAAFAQAAPAATSASAPAANPAPVATYATSTSVYANAPGTQFAPAVAQQTVYTQTAPASTTTYAYPAAYPYYSSYPYYGGYCGYSYPSFSLGIGIGLGGWCGGGWGGGCYRGWGSGCWGGFRAGFCGFGAGCGFRGGFCHR